MLRELGVSVALAHAQRSGRISMNLEAAPFFWLASQSRRQRARRQAVRVEINFTPSTPTRFGNGQPR